MAKTKRRRAESSHQPSASTEEQAGEQPSFLDPLPPPRRNKPLLILMAALVLGWIAALIWLVLAG